MPAGTHGHHSRYQAVKELSTISFFFRNQQIPNYFFSTKVTLHQPVMWPAPASLPVPWLWPLREPCPAFTSSYSDRRRPCATGNQHCQNCSRHIFPLSQEVLTPGSSGTAPSMTSGCVWTAGRQPLKMRAPVITCLPLSAAGLLGSTLFIAQWLEEDFLPLRALKADVFWFCCLCCQNFFS